MYDHPPTKMNCLSGQYVFSVHRMEPEQSVLNDFWHSPMKI